MPAHELTPAAVPRLERVAGGLPVVGARAAPLLDREAEVATMQALVAAAREGIGHLVVIEARAGMGKTRLVAEARSAANAAGLNVLAARGGELEREFAYGVVRQLFEPALERESVENRAELLSGAARVAEPLFGNRELAALDPVSVSFAMQHGLYWLAANVAAQRPTLITVDDVQWADGPSLRWLGYLARRLEGLPLLLIVALRAADHSPYPALVGGLVSEPGAVHVGLQPLETESVAALIRWMFGADPDPTFTASCYEASGGNPLFLRALLQTLADQGVPPDTCGASRVGDVGPQPVARYVGLALSRLPAEATGFARAAAILGDGAELRHAATLARIEPADSEQIRSGLTQSDILRPLPRIEFVHPVIRASIYESIGLGERQASHRAAAHLLLSEGAQLEQVVAHVMRVPPAGDPFALDILRRAAAGSLARGDADTAVSQLRRALSEPPVPTERADLLTELGSAELLVSGPSAVGHLREARQLTVDPVAGAQISIALARALFFTQNVEDAVDTYQRELARMPGDEHDLRRTMEAGLANVAMYEPELQHAADDIFDRARAASLGSGISGKTLLALLAFHDALSGDADAAITVARAREALGQHILMEQDNGGAPFVLACRVLAASGHVAEVLATLDTSLQYATKQGSALGYAAAHVFRAEACLFSGDLVAAEAEAREALAATTAWGIELGHSYPTAFLAFALMDRGDLDEAAGVVANARFRDEIPHNGHAIYVLLARSRLLALQGHTQRAFDDFLEVGRRYFSVGGRTPALISWRSEASLLALQLGALTAARSLANEELESARAYGAPRPLGISLRTAGLVAGGAQGEDFLREAVDLLGASDACLEHARALVDLGAAVRRRNERSEARRLLRQGIDIALHCGAMPLAERANDELAATGAHRRTVLLSGVDALTASERRVAQLAATELSNRDIAQALFITVKTVEQHLGRVYRKLDIDSRRQLAEALD